MAKNVLIVGAGVIGLSAAYYAARRGFRVTVIDRAPALHDGCSFGNAGMIVPSHFIPLAAPGMVALGLKWMWNPESPFYIKPRLDRDLLDWGLKFWRAATPEHVRRSAPVLRDLSFASRACFEELSTLPGNDFGLVKKGLVMLCKTQHALDEEAKTATEANRLGIPAEVLDATATSKLDPNVTMTVAGSVYFPKDCHLTPGRFMAGLQRQLDALGATFSWDTEVTGWRVANGQVEAARTSQGELAADEYVLAGGSWSPVVARDLGLRIPMQAGKGYSLTLPKPRQLPEICSIFTEARIAVTPMSGALRFGGTMEIAGLNEEINPVRVRGIIRAVPSYYPEFTPADFAGIQPWRGLRPCSPDGLPYLGRTTRYANLTIATGHAMMGLSLGPITGKLVAEILSGERPAIDLTLLDPDRYQ
ncbi:MAG TPA: FAD-dependent oxidoreductase [Verrucomicrobiae bacterium]|nr:FAD-dependent oxidoreductase [Verrucomicrobiae bacterium]